MSHAITPDSNKPTRTENALRWVGDLDHPFYDDERNRFVWYEASAISFQFLLVANFVSMGLILWIGGASGLPYALAFFVPTVAASIIVESSVKQRRAMYWPGREDFTRSRGITAIAATVFWLSGACRAVLDLPSDDGQPFASFIGGAQEGLFVGLLAGPIGAIVALTLARRKQNRTDSEL